MLGNWHGIVGSAGGSFLCTSMKTYNGIGTKLYGRAEAHPDGSCVVTKWVVFLYFPIMPLGSYRVWPEMDSIPLPGGTVMMLKNEKVKYNFFSTTQRFRMQKVKWQWKQIITTYKVGLIGFSIFLLVTWFLSKLL